MLQLRLQSSPEWIRAVLSDFESFLIDHAHNERKAAASALVLMGHYPGRQRLVTEMVALAQEELAHFEKVKNLLNKRKIELTHDVPDPYMGKLLKLLRKKDAKEYLLDRLLVFGIVEARGCERFQLVGDRVSDKQVAQFYSSLAASEAKHHVVFTNLAREYFPLSVVKNRLEDLLKQEAGIVASMEVRPFLH